MSRTSIFILLLGIIWGAPVLAVLVAYIRACYMDWCLKYARLDPGKQSDFLVRLERSCQTTYMRAGVGLHSRTVSEGAVESVTALLHSDEGWLAHAGSSVRAAGRGPEGALLDVPVLISDPKGVAGVAHCMLYLN